MLRIFLIFGDDGGGATPVPIPNTEVKSSSVEGTWRAAAWESRTLPDKDLIQSIRLDFFVRFMMINEYICKISPSKKTAFSWRGINTTWV